MIMRCPDLWQHFSKQNDEGGDHRNFYQEFYPMRILIGLERDHLIDKQVGKNDNGNIHQAISNKQSCH